MVKFDWDNVTFPVLGSYGAVDCRVTLIGVVMHCWVMGEVTSSSTWRESLMVTSPAELIVPVAVPGVTSEKMTLVVPVAFVDVYGWIESDAALMTPVSGSTVPVMVTGSGT